MKIIILAVMFLTVSPFTFAADEVEPRSVEVPGQIEPQIEEALKTRPVKKIEEKEVTMPEVPKPLKTGKPGEAEDVALEAIEQDQAAGVLTETEAQVEKDNQRRSANLTF